MSPLISVDEALRCLREQRPDWSTETVPLSEALGARLAEPVIARVTQPPAAVSAMDGYAVRLTDVAMAGTTLEVIGESPAGAPFQGRVEHGQAVRIFTGGQVPDGADHIVIQESVSRMGTQITCAESYDAPRHIRKAGRDFHKGEELVPAGITLGPAEISAAAGANLADLVIAKRPTVAILANGDELRSPGSTLEVGQIVNSNPEGLSALITQWGGRPINLGIAGDSLAAIGKKLALADDADIIVPVGGASVGDHDHMRPAFAAAGFDPVFEKIAVKPGKPTWLSRRGDTLALGLPGNPASALVCAHLFLRPLIDGSCQLPLKKAKLRNAVPANGPRESFLRVQATIDDQGIVTASLMPDQDSSLMRPFLKANALLRRLPEAGAAEAGTLVDILLIGPL